jgi:hypothetical protein
MVQEVKTGKQKVDLSKWDSGDFILRIVADNAQNSHILFTWNNSRVV